MKLLKAWILLVALLPVVLMSTPVAADTALPSSTPTLEAKYVYRNLLETGDALFLVYANVPYTTPPSTTFPSTFIWQLVDTDNTTLIAITTGSVYRTSGYGYNLFSFYLDADAAIVWERPYNLKLIGNPVAFASPPIYNFQFNASDYTTYSTTADNQAELANTIINIADDLDTKWGLTSDDYLITQGDTGTFLSSRGEAFARGAVYGLQALAPDAFQSVVTNIEIDARTWGTGYSTNLTTQMSGTWWDTASAAATLIFGTGWNLVGVMILMVLCAGLMFGNIYLTNDAWNGFIDVSVLLIVFARLGMYQLGFLLMLGAICIVYIGLKIFRPF